MPLPVEMQVPFWAKQPELMLTPLATVVVPVFETLKSVVVAFAVDEAMANSVVLVAPLFACTESCANGVEVPTPNVPPSEPSARPTVIALTALFMLNDAKALVVPPNCKRLKSVEAAFENVATPSTPLATVKRAPPVPVIGRK